MTFDIGAAHCEEIPTHKVEFSDIEFKDLIKYALKQFGSNDTVFCVNEVLFILEGEKLRIYQPLYCVDLDDYVRGHTLKMKNNELVEASSGKVIGFTFTEHTSIETIKLTAMLDHNYITLQIT